MTTETKKICDTLDCFAAMARESLTRQLALRPDSPAYFPLPGGDCCVTMTSKKTGCCGVYDRRARKVTDEPVLNELWSLAREVWDEVRQRPVVDDPAEYVKSHLLDWLTENGDEEDCRVRFFEVTGYRADGKEWTFGFDDEPYRGGGCYFSYEGDDDCDEALSAELSELADALRYEAEDRLRTNKEEAERLREEDDSGYWNSRGVSGGFLRNWP